MDISRDQDDNGRRWYEHGDNDALSVTTILGIGLDEDDTGLQIWRSNNDGQGDNPYWEHLYWYSGNRGTLAHYQALQKFEQVFDGDDMWGEGEAAAMSSLVNGPTEDDLDYPESDGNAPADSHAVAYSVLKDQNVVESREQFEALFPETTAVDVLHTDVDYFVDEFGEICEFLGITPESIITVEKYLFNGDVRFGGQTDLLYRDPNGNVVVVDLKTSGSFRQTHRLQSVAYARTIETSERFDVDDVDRIEIIQIDPDDKVVEVHSHEYPSHIDESDDRYTTDYWYEDKWGEFEYDDLEDMWDTFKDTANNAYDRIDT